MMYQDRDYELLSAYLDDALEADERAALEARLETDAALRRELAALRQTVALIRALPTLKAPRNFTLTAAQAEQIRPQDTSATFTPDSQDSTLPDNIMTLPTSRPMGRGTVRRASRQPFWVGAAAAVVLGMVCVATLLLALPSLNRMPSSSLQNDDGNAVSGVSTATAFDTAEGEQESQAAAETLSDGSTTTESAEDNGGTGGAAVPLEPSTTANKVGDPGVTAQTFDLASTSAASPAPMGTLGVPRMMSETEILNTQTTDTFAYDLTAEGAFTLTAEDLVARNGMTIVPPGTVSPPAGSPLPASPSPQPSQPSQPIAGYMTLATQATGMMTDALRMDETAPPTNEITADDVTDEEAASGAGTTDTDTPADSTFSAVIAATEPVANMQQSIPPIVGEAELDALGGIVSPSSLSFSITQLLLLAWTLLQIILRLF